MLATATSASNTLTAARPQISQPTVGKWRRFLTKRLDGLLDEPRPGVPRRITNAQVEQVLTRTLETTPWEDTHCSTRRMASACGLSQPVVSGSGTLSDYSRMGPRHVSTPPIPCPLRRSVTSWVCICSP